MGTIRVGDNIQVNFWSKKVKYDPADFVGSYQQWVQSGDWYVVIELVDGETSPFRILHTAPANTAAVTDTLELPVPDSVLTVKPTMLAVYLISYNPHEFLDSLRASLDAQHNL